MSDEPREYMVDGMFFWVRARTPQAAIREVERRMALAFPNDTSAYDFADAHAVPWVREDDADWSAQQGV